ncbi:MAG: secondary thiamine-phosphate synthase enzyme YjbQ [Thermodesulfobacteriota bacterium]
MQRLSLKTNKRCELLDITEEVAGAVKESGVRDGIVIVYCPHTTAAITINENADPSVCRDILMKTSKVIEEGDPEYRHGEGNSDSHVKSSLTGASETIIIEKGRLVLGTWQGVYFCEFDGPRSRNCFLKILAG